MCAPLGPSTPTGGHQGPNPTSTPLPPLRAYYPCKLRSMNERCSLVDTSSLRNGYGISRRGRGGVERCGGPGGCPPYLVNVCSLGPFHPDGRPPGPQPH